MPGPERAGPGYNKSADLLEEKIDPMDPVFRRIKKDLNNHKEKVMDVTKFHARIKREVKDLYKFI